MTIPETGPGSHACDLAELRVVAAQLKEATALLREAYYCSDARLIEEWGCRYLALVPRPAAQLAAPTAGVLDHTRCTPTSGRLLGSSPIPRPSSPAGAPEPGEDYACADMQGPVVTDRQAAVRWMKRAEAAEARLAAVAKGLDALIECVRTNYIEIIRTDDDSMCDALDPEQVEDDLKAIRSLLTAPSPGAGKETL